MVYYYGLLQGNEKEKELIEKFGMLKDIDIEQMIFLSLTSTYRPSAHYD